MPAPQRTARIEDEIWDAAQARAQAEGASVAALMRAAVQRYGSGQLTSQAIPASQPPATVTSHPQPVARAGLALATGEPSPGIACAGPGCWQRDTARYGLRKVPLCPACAAALAGEVYQREIPLTAARVLRGTPVRPVPARAG